jgi:predicted CXXCH cytochrome family protein
MKDQIDLVSTLVSLGKTADPTGAVQLTHGNVECTSCHNPHVQGTDRLSLNFLVRDGSRGQICLSCHDPNRTTVNNTTVANPMAGWQVGIHATAGNSVAGQVGLGNYGTIAGNACLSCHAPHNAPGAARLLRGANEQACISCHSGGTNVLPNPPNIFAELSKPGHPLPNATNVHDAAESAMLNNNRHAGCVDCHNAHGARKVTGFNSPPVIRASQTGATGVAMDGYTAMAPAVSQYETCLRCHGNSAGKATNPIYGYLPAREVADPLNVIPQMDTNAKSNHPVMHVRNSRSASQPSLLQTMLDLNGTTTNYRAIGNQIFCTDCHNSDDNREFGSTGANGPHGSKWPHILERQYVYSQAPAGPGTPITVNINKNPDLSVHGPYAMCAKCHDLSVVMGSTSWAYHKSHVSDDGVSCSVCHNAHGMTSTSANPTGVRMVDFDLNVVGKNGAAPISYNPATNTCTLKCHGYAH